MRVWNPQLEQHLENFETQSDDACESAASGAVDDKTFSAGDRTNKPNNVSNGPGVSDISIVSSISLEELIVVGVLASLCWYLGTSYVHSNVAVILLLSSVVAYRVMLWCNKTVALHFQAQNKARYTSCRMQIMRMLGSIGAPPLMLIPSTTSSQTTSQSPILSTDSMLLLLDFVRVHVDFINKVDDCLEMLEIGVCMSLRSTRASVHRVELGSWNRNTDTIILPTARQRLAQVMMNHFNELQEIILSATNEERIEVPTVVSLAWLKTLRLDFVDLLSFQVSQLLLTCSSRFENVVVSESLLQQRLNEAIMHAKESTEYLASAFCVSEDSMVDAELQHVCRQFEKASIALWACNESSYQDDSSGETTKQHDNGQALKFLEHFEGLLLSVSNLKEKWDSNRKNDKADEEGADGTVTNSPTIPPNLDQGDYEHSGTSPKLDESLQRQEGGLHNKTVVFSGSAHRTEASSPMDENDTASSSQHFVDSQGVVLRELQQRIEQMEPAEEVDANGNPVTKHEHETTLPRKRPEDEEALAESSSVMFLGASGSLLSELKSSIGNHDASTWEVTTS